LVIAGRFAILESFRVKVVFCCSTITYRHDLSLLISLFYKAIYNLILNEISSPREFRDNSEIIGNG